MDIPDPQEPSQHFEQVMRSAISFSGDASTYNIAGDQHLHYAARPKPWTPPLMLPPRAQSFVGRDEDLSWLLQQLVGEAHVTLAICGPGGMGKTALVAEAMTRLVAQEDWSVRFPDGIFYHSFYAYPSLAIAFEELARIFEEEPDGDPYRAALRALSRRRALLIFDGVEVLADVFPLRELGGKNVVLLLSRRQSDAPDRTHCCTLDLLSQEQGIRLLQNLAGSRAADRQCVERLVQHIGGYPLALHIIGSYLSSRQEEVSDYLKWFEEKGLASLDHGKRQAQSVPLLLQRTYDSLASDEQYVFLALGLLAPAPFPAELMQGILALPERAIRQALGTLVNLSVLRRPDLGYEVSHPLIHTFAAESLSLQMNAVSSSSANAIMTWRERLLTTLIIHFKQSNPYDRVVLALWLPHVVSLLSATELTPQQYLKAAYLFSVAGVKSFTQGKYAEAEPLYLRSLAIYEQQWGTTHPDIVKSLNNLATLYKNQGKYTEAEPLFQQALAICEQQLDDTDPDMAFSLNNLAMLYRDQGKYAEAESLFRRALVIWQQTLEENHPNILSAQMNYASLVLTMGRDAKVKTRTQDSTPSYHQREATRQKAKNKMAKKSRKNNRNR